MFDDRQDVKAMFEQFRTVENANDLYSNRALENHALIVMNALDESISNMDDEEYLVNFLITTGKSHHRFENFSASVFWVCPLKLKFGHCNTKNKKSCVYDSLLSIHW